MYILETLEENLFLFAFPSRTKNLASTQCSWFNQEPVEPVDGESGLPVGAGE